MKVLDKVKITVDHLKPGMYVSELDIPWDDSPYILHGFKLHNQSDIKKIRKICDYVYVDTKSLESVEKEQEAANNAFQADFASQHSGKYQVIDVNLPKEAKKLLGKGGSIADLPVPKVTTDFQEELPRAREIYGRLYKETTKVFLAVDHDQIPVIKPLTSLILEIIASIGRNPSAFEWIALTNPNDKSVKQHCINVCILSLKFGHHIGLPDRINRLLGLAGLVFDLGKTLMSDAILNKPSSLTPTEMNIMQKHPEIGASIIQATGDVAPEILNVCLNHHERMDGSGYPNQLRGTDIDLLSRIIAIVDTYNAIITAKYYAERSSSSQALDELYKSREKGYDRALVEAFIRMNGIYPVGTAIETSSGEIGLVVTNNAKSKLSPSVLMVLNREKQPYPEENIIDFATTLNDNGEPRYTVKQAVNPNFFDINPKDCFRNM
jgi:HD-GYP domain-containing protein (c-di-GMP phosphodiesterase class II)